MKHLKRSDCRKQTRKAIIDYCCKDNETDMVERQVNQDWERKEQEEAERIQRETDSAWAEYELINGNDSEEGNEKILQCEDDIIEPEESEPVNPKGKKRSTRRRATKRANKRLIMKSKDAVKNSRKRSKDDLRNLTYHKSEELKSRVARCDSLEKKATKLQR